MGTFEIVLKRAWLCSSRFVPVGAPIGFSGAFSSVGASVFSAQAFSDGDGLRSSKTSETGLSAKALLTFAFGSWSGIRLPALLSRTALDDRGGVGSQQGYAPTERLVSKPSRSCALLCLDRDHGRTYAFHSCLRRKS